MNPVKGEKFNKIRCLESGENITDKTNIKYWHGNQIILLNMRYRLEFICIKTRIY